MTETGTLPPPTAKQMDKAVADLCRNLNLLHYHTHDSRRSQKGFPDWTILTYHSGHRHLMVYCELKTDKDQVSYEQYKWINELTKVPYTSAFIVRGADGLGLFTDFLVRLQSDNYDKYFIDTFLELSRMTNKELKKVEKRAAKKGVVL